MSKPMEQQDDEPDLSLKEWALKARLTRENTTSRTFSASNLKSFREAAAISSTASSPGYTLKDEIDPSTYSFTTALKALQAKTWEYESPEGLTLNSKWNDAEKYICNPLSGEVPLECLSVKTLSGRSFRTRITMSAPLIYPPSKEKTRGPTRDVGTQSTPLEMSSTSPSPASTPSIVERSPVKVACGDDSSSAVSSGKLKSESTELQK